MSQRPFFLGAGHVHIDACTLDMPASLMLFSIHSLPHVPMYVPMSLSHFTEY